MPAQITVLLGLSAGLFDAVPLERMTDAEAAVHTATSGISVEVVGRLATATTLDAADRQVLIDLATKALSSFQVKPTDSTPPAQAKPAVASGKPA